MEDFGRKFNATIVELLLMISVYILHVIISIIKACSSFFIIIIFTTLLLTLPVWAVPAYIYQEVRNNDKQH